MPDALTDSTVVFDLDGTLVDTAPDLLRALNQVLDLEGLAHPPEAVVRFFVGRGARALIERATRLSGTAYTAERLDQLTAAFIEFYAADIAALSRPFPGLIEALDELEAAGAVLAVCTNKRTDLSLKVLEAVGLAGRFAAIVGADAVKACKPDPGHFLETVSRAGGQGHKAIMVGDTETDAAAARAAGAPIILVRFGYTEDPSAVDADFTIGGYEELAAAARRLLSA
jgi:phosphoglycolate phosphatase